LLKLGGRKPAEAFFTRNGRFIAHFAADFSAAWVVNFAGCNDSGCDTRDSSRGCEKKTIS
jgi:hypothetical protein